MKTPKEKQARDLLDLPQKERIQLCKEIRSILTQRVQEEKHLPTQTTTETHIQAEMGIFARIESYPNKIRESPVLNHIG